MSVLFYTGGLAAVAGLVAIVRPLPRIRLATRRRAALVCAGGTAAVALAAGRLPAATTVSPQVSELDRFVPAFHFSERHHLDIEASAGDVFDAVKATTASDIALFQSFTWVRRFGRAGQESILNAPAGAPLLDVATRTTFVRLSEQTNREIVIGTVIVAPAGFRRAELATPDDFLALARPGFAIAALHFLIDVRDERQCRLTTETRVFATDASALRRFTPYWRAIYPGSTILRVTWLRAIKRRAERASAVGDGD